MHLFDQKFSAVLFDMDGTLISSIAAVNRAWNRLAEEYGTSMDKLGNFHGTPAKQLVHRLLPDHSVAEREKALERIIHLETVDTDGIEILPGAQRSLQALDAAGRCAIVTSCSAGLAEARLQVTQLPIPQLVVTADDVEIGKPDPAPYLLAAEKLGVPPAECLVVEDAPVGIKSGLAAGMRVLAVEFTHTAEELHEAHATVADLSKVRFEVQEDGITVREE